MIDRYASHLPVLCRILVDLEPRDILEVGCGGYSTPLLRTYVSARGGQHYILETNEDFGRQVSQLYGCQVTIFDGKTLPSGALSPWGLAFIDHAVESARSQIALALQKWSSIIVLHDSNPDWDRAYGYSKIIPQWQYHKQFTALYPHTLVLTDSDEVWQALKGA